MASDHKRGNSWKQPIADPYACGVASGLCRTKGE